MKHRPGRLITADPLRRGPALQKQKVKEKGASAPEAPIGLLILVGYAADTSFAKEQTQQI